MKVSSLFAARGFAACAALAMLSVLAATQFVQRPTITRAVDLIELPAEKMRVGVPASFNLRTTAAAKRLAVQGVVVRIFSLLADQKVPVPITQADGCDVYLSVAHQLVLSGPDQLKFATVATLDKDWLNLSNSLNSVEAGHYYFVFEQSSSAMAATEQFRIKTSDARKYFETGFRVTIDPTGHNITADSLRQKFLDRSARLGQLKIDVDQKTDSPPCYGYQPVTVRAAAKRSLEQGVLLACAPDQSSDVSAEFPLG
jgi:hypothetical protein